MQICITLDIFFNTAKAQICTYLKLFYFYHIHIWHIFAKFHASRWLRSKFMAILGWSVARRIKFFLSKSLKTEYAIKSRDLLCFYSNFNTTLILIVEVCWKSQTLKIFKFRPPHSSGNGCVLPQRLPAPWLPAPCNIRGACLGKYWGWKGIMT